jgi:hypothetical protein
VGAEVDYIVSGAAQARNQILFECETAVIGCDSYPHTLPFKRSSSP